MAGDPTTPIPVDLGTRLDSFLKGYTVDERSFVFTEPDLVGFAFLRGTSICYFNHVRLEEDGNVSGIIGDASAPGFEIVSISRDTLLLDCFRWMDSKTVLPFAKTIHVGEVMDADNLTFAAFKNCVATSARLSKAPL